MDSTGFFHLCLLVSSELPADLPVFRDLLWFGVFNDNWHNLCLNDIVWAEYFHVPQTGESTFCFIDWKSYSYVAHSKIQPSKLFSPLNLTSAGSRVHTLERVDHQLPFKGNLSSKEVYLSCVNGEEPFSFCGSVSKIMCKNITEFWLPQEQIKSKGLLH